MDTPEKKSARYLLRLAACLFALALTGPTARSQEDDAMAMSGETFPPGHLDFFEKKIRPVLVKHCYECHSAEAEKTKGDLRLDWRGALLRGGETGPAVVPGDPDASLLLEAIAYEDDDLEMPPKEQLPADVVSDFEKWILLGAPDPRGEAPSGGEEVTEKYTSTIDIERGREHWSYQPPDQPDLTPVEDPGWTRRDLDRFVLARLEAEGLSPAPDADPLTLLRRLHFDLIGLPPTPEETKSFATAHAADPETALAETVDRLLDSPRFGERWGRHWLDVARYAESSGNEVNMSFPHAWRYRDYVIDSFNADKPYDRFVTEQIAGDLLPADTDAQRAEQLIATGFLAIGTKSLGEANARQFRFDLVDEQIDTATRAFLATTAACARCHDHKTDPISQSDYYALAGIFLSSETFYGTAPTTPQRRHSELIILPVHDPDPPIEDMTLAEQIQLDFAILRQRDALDDIFERSARLRREGKTAEARNVRLGAVRTRARLALLETRRDRYDSEGLPLAQAMGMADRAEPFDSQLLIRGEEDKATAERVPRGFVRAIATGDKSADTPSIPGDQSGRLQLAEWIASPENPLTARVMSNRVWHWLFGQGLVRSVDDFGATGEAPSHPELLDHLAIHFQENGWSVKELIREIALSRTYRMDSRFEESHYQKDPENRLLWRRTPRRLDAESLRDAILAASGRLETEAPSASVIAEIGDGTIGRSLPAARIETDSRHRSVYLPIVRDLVPDALATFDFANPSLLTGAREATTVPSQALYLMNSDFLADNAEALARRVSENGHASTEDQLRNAFALTLSRPPRPAEIREAETYLERFAQAARSEGIAPEQADFLALATQCQTLLASAEFCYLD